MAADRYYGTSKNTGLAEWGTDTQSFTPGSITDAAVDNAGIFTGDTLYDGVGGIDLSVGANAPGMTTGYGMSDLGSSLGGAWDAIGGLQGLTGLAELWMGWDKLQSTKASVRDSHNASAKQYNNYLSRGKGAAASMGLSGGYDTRTNVKKSTV